MTRPGAISIVTAIFLAGVAVGVLGAQLHRDARRESARLHGEFEPAVHEHIRQTRERVATILTPEQLEALDTLTAEHRGDLERMFLTPGDP